MLLEKDQELVDTLNQLLEAYRLGFSTFSSPVNPIMRVVIDLILKLRNLFKEGGSKWDHPPNKSIRFLDGISAPWVPDALGNPKQISFRDRPSFAQDAQLSQYFEKIALQLTEIKRSKTLPKNLYSFGNRQDPKKQINKSNYHYFRRTRDKRKKQFTNKSEK